MSQVVTDLFSKQADFMACPKILSTPSLAKMFVQHIYLLHRAPEHFISDQGVQFTSSFWEEFLKLLSISQELSFSHIPHTNGACKWTNGLLEQYVCCQFNYQQDNWTELLPFVEVVYNNSVHSSIGFTSFQMDTGREFVSIPELPQFLINSVPDKFKDMTLQFQ